MIASNVGKPALALDRIVSPSLAKADMIVNIDYLFQRRLETLSSSEKKNTQLDMPLLMQLNQGTFPPSGFCQVLKEMSDLMKQQCVSRLSGKY
jgi:hypothetical protein